MSRFRDVLRSGAAEIGVELDEAELQAHERLWRLIVEWNHVMNLTRIVDEQEAALKHYVDSLTLLRLPVFVPGRRVVDVGSGPGFPGLPVRIQRPDLRLTLVESTQKKARFLRDACVALGVTDVEVIADRAEELARRPRGREWFDVAVCRALAPMPTLLEWCLPLVRVGGFLVAMKGPAGREEAEEGKAVAALLGGRLACVEEVNLPQGAGARTLVTWAKIRATAPAYPRSGGKARSRPLVSRTPRGGRQEVSGGKRRATASSTTSSTAAGRHRLDGR